MNSGAVSTLPHLDRVTTASFATKISVGACYRGTRVKRHETLQLVTATKRAPGTKQLRGSGLSKRSVAHTVCCGAGTTMTFLPTQPVDGVG